MIRCHGGDRCFLPPIADVTWPGRATDRHGHLCYVHLAALAASTRIVNLKPMGETL